MGPLARDRPAQPLPRWLRVTGHPVLPTSAPHAIPELVRRLAVAPGPQPPKPALLATPRPRPALPVRPALPPRCGFRPGAAPSGAQSPDLACGTTGLGQGQPGTHSRPRGCGSASRCRRSPGHRGWRRSAGWRTPGLCQAQGSCRTCRLRSSAGGVPGRGTGQTSWEGGGVGHTLAGPPHPPSTSARLPSWSLAQPASHRTSARGQAAVGGEGAPSSVAARCRDPRLQPWQRATQPQLAHLWGQGSCSHGCQLWGCLPDPALNASSGPGQPLSVRPPAQPTLPRQERSGRSEKAQGYLTRLLSPVDIRSPCPGPSRTQHLPVVP